MMLLAAPPLLGGRARGRRSRRAASSAIAASAIAAPDPRRGHRVVAAAVAQPGQRVVLGEDPDPRAVAAAAAGPRGADRRGQAAGRVLDLEAVGAQRVGDPRRRLDLLERRLGVGVDPVRQVEDLVAGGLDGGGDPGLDVGMRLGGDGGRSRRADGDRRAADGSGTGTSGRDGWWSGPG